MHSIIQQSLLLTLIVLLIKIEESTSPTCCNKEELAFRGKCYEINDNLWGTLEGHMDVCHVITPESADEFQKFHKELLVPLFGVVPTYWIGLNGTGTPLTNPASFEWIDYPPVIKMPTAEFPWKAGYPIGAKYFKCVAANPAGTWQNVDCTSTRKMVACEYEEDTDYDCCEDGWFRLDEKCYLIKRGERLSRDGTKAMCESMSGTMIEPEDQETLDKINHAFRALFTPRIPDFWIGLQGKGFSHKDADAFSWVSGASESERIPLNELPWMSVYPLNSAAYKCVYTFWDGTWKNGGCTVRRPLACQADAT